MLVIQRNVALENRVPFPAGSIGADARGLDETDRQELARLMTEWWQTVSTSMQWDEELEVFRYSGELFRPLRLPDGVGVICGKGIFGEMWERIFR